ncbi:MAG: cupredoxin domain-containing protein [Mycobacteriales bacterium]|nr:cupredoxin domain-containing protein [Frankia sp.]
MTPGGTSAGRLALVLLSAVGLGGVGCSPGSAATPLTVELTAHYSHYAPTAVTVPHGRPIRFVIHNTDAIDHEFIVGDDAVQLRHERGTEAHHGVRPTEVSIAALRDATTTIEFDRATTLTYACHLPGHFAYGMHGTLRIT